MKYILVVVAILFGCTRNPEPPTANPVSPKTGADKPVVGELTKAVIQNDASRVSRLIEMGADVNENIGSQPNRITPLLAAVAMGNQTLANALIMRGASPLFSYGGYDTLDYADHLSLSDTLNMLSTWK